ncbi:MAG: carbon-nitrogen hydrolase family protein [Bryobacteraceae bacterium]
MDRRQFIKNSAVALSSMTPAEAALAAAEEQEKTQSASVPDHAGRPVRAVSIGFTPGPSLEQIAGLVDKEGARGADLIALPETFRGQDEHTQETLDGPTVSALARLAEKHRTYIVVPIDRKDGDRRLNSAVILDRRGRIAGVYDKVYPFWVDEFTRRPPVQPGQTVTVISTDFGRLGIAICFDVNWAPLWQRLSDFGAELVIWPSAYSAGRTLQARAIDFSYYVMSATWVPDCLVFDIDGEQLVHEKANSGEFNITRFTFDLDRCIFHQDLNLPGRLAKLLNERGDDVAQEKWLPMEGCFVLKAKRPGVSARALARQYGLEERRPYLNRSRSEVDKARGWQFS